MSNETSTEDRPWTTEPAPFRTRRFGRKALATAAGAVGVLVVSGLIVSGVRGSGNDGATTEGSHSSASGNMGEPQSSTSWKRTEHGVPVGYTHTEAGAKSAATNFQIAQSTAAFIANPKTRHKITSVVMAPEAVKDRTATLDDQCETAMSKLGVGTNGKTSSGAALVNRQGVLAADVTSYSEDVATVRLWTVAVTGVADGASKLPPTSEFNDWNYTLRWVDGDWKAVSITRSAALVPQATTGEPSAPDAFRELGGDTDAPPYVR